MWTELMSAKSVLTSDIAPKNVRRRKQNADFVHKYTPETVNKNKHASNAKTTDTLLDIETAQRLKNKLKLEL